MLLRHNDPEQIAEDFARSEALGQVIVDADFEPLPHEAPPAQYVRTLQRRVDLVSGDVTWSWLVERL